VEKLRAEKKSEK